MNIEFYLYCGKCLSCDHGCSLEQSHRDSLSSLHDEYILESYSIAIALERQMQQVSLPK